jgi:hypothetical protein
VKTLSSLVKRFPKILFALSRCRIPKVKGSRDLLSRSPVHAGARKEEGYGGGAIVRRGKILAHLDLSSGGGQWVIYIGKSTDLASHSKPIRFRVPYLADLEPKSPKIETAKGNRTPARRGAGFRRTIHAGAMRPRPLPPVPVPVPVLEPSPARRGVACARVWCFSSLPYHIAWRGGDNLHIYVGDPTPPLAR